MGSTGMWTLLEREVQRYVRNWRNTLLPPLITNSLYIIVFGSVLGTRIDDIQGFPYIVYILPGLITLGAIMNAFENTSFSIFHARWDDYIDEVLTSPMSYREMLAAYVGAAISRGILAGIGILLVAFLFTAIPFRQPLYFIAFLLLSTTLFASFGILIGLWADEFSDLSTFSNFLITPLVFLGGVFYSLQMLPGIWRQISYLNPMAYMVNGLRYGMLGQADIPPMMSLGALFLATVVLLAIDIRLFRTGYGLRE